MQDLQGAIRIESTVRSIKNMCDQELKSIKEAVFRLEDEKSKMQEENNFLEERARNAEQALLETSKKLNHIIGFINAGQAKEGIKNAFPKKDYLLGDDWGSHLLVMGGVQLERLERFFGEELEKRNIHLKNDCSQSLNMQNLDWNEDELKKRECVILFVSGDDIESSFRASDIKHKDDSVRSDNERMIEENVKEFVDLVDFFKDIGKDIIVITPGLRDTRNLSGSERKGLIASAFIRFGEELEKTAKRYDCIIGVMNLAKIMHKQRFYFLKKGDSKKLNEGGVTFVWNWVKETLQVLPVNVPITEEDSRGKKRKFRVNDAGSDQCLRCWEKGHHARDCFKEIDPCFRCGSTSHVSDACNALRNKCEECGGTGHYKRVCPAALHKAVNIPNKRPRYGDANYAHSNYSDNSQMSMSNTPNPNEFMAESFFNMMNQFKANMNNIMGQASMKRT